VVAVRVISPTENTYSAGRIIKFSTVQLNVGNAYDVNSGVFTAPVSGLYLFTAQLCGHKGNHFYMEIVKNGNALQRSMVVHSGSFQCCNADTVDVLAQGDTVSLKTPTSASTTIILREDQNTWSSFTGALLRET